MGLGQKTVDSDVKAEAKNIAADLKPEPNAAEVEDNALDNVNEDADLKAAERLVAEAKAKKAAKAAAKKKVEEDAAAAAREIEEKKQSSEEVTEEVTDEELKSAKPAEEKAVATKPTAGAVAVAKPAFTGMVLASKENALPPLDFGTLARFKAVSGGVIKGEEGDLGKSCTVTVISYNNTFAVAPNEDKAPKNLCKFSTDGVNLNDGSGLVDDYIQELRDDGYEKASSKRYVELIAIIDDAEKDHEEIGNMVTFSLSPTSVKSFERHRLQCSVKLQMNPSLKEEDFARVKITAKPKSFPGKDFVFLDFSAAE